MVGRKIDYPGLTYAPTNENGVILLFGMICERMNLVVERIRPPFPDAVVVDYREDETRGIQKKVEFEFASSNFRRQKHISTDCDIIVCWEDDWKSHPKELEIIELRSEINKFKQEEKDVRRAERTIQKAPITPKVPSKTGAKRPSGWEEHKRRLTSSDAVERKIVVAKAHGVSEKYLRFLERLKRYWEIREQRGV